MTLKRLFSGRRASRRFSAHINQHFGENVIPLYKELGLKGHNGLDLGAIDGSPVYAAHDGIVTFTGEDGAGGLTVVIRSNEEFELNEQNTFIKTLYVHLKKNSFLVKPGDVVKVGQKIAEADNTGASTGSHLHFGLKPIQRGEEDWQWYNIGDKDYRGAIDPEPYLYFNQQFTKVMKYGQSSNDIARLQKKLKDLGLFKYPQITGFYGEITRQAVYKFQQLYKVASILELSWVNGMQVGIKTLAKLNSV